MKVKTCTRLPQLDVARPYGPASHLRICLWVHVPEYDRTCESVKHHRDRNGQGNTTMSTTRVVLPILIKMARYMRAEEKKHRN